MATIVPAQRVLAGSANVLTLQMPSIRLPMLYRRRPFTRLKWSVCRVRFGLPSGTRTLPSTLPALKCLLGHFRQLAPESMHLSISAQQLRRACAKMNGKAPGPDGWTALQLGLLPLTWWEAAACLWNACIQHGTLPKVWTRAAIVLIPKSRDETRPIALCSILWRSGARCIAAALRPWCEKWCGHGALGAAPGRSTACAHARLLLARDQGCSSFVQQDLSAFFDSLDVRAICALLRRFGAPTQVCTLLQAFYASPCASFELATGSPAVGALLREACSKAVLLVRSFPFLWVPLGPFSPLGLATPRATYASDRVTLTMSFLLMTV